MKLRIIEKDPSVVVVTPTIGKETLALANKSVNSQNYTGDITHLVVADGPEHMAEASKHL